ncbi:MAG TPA: nucleotidyltransferase family protein [Acidiferrobacterales bacterium]|nr:nucleotidyltransferase family protein [Acidiferrobacterales bacterium]
MNAKVTIDPDSIANFCRRWKITELSLFGSVLRADFRPDSDIDLLASFAPDADWSLLDHAAMQEELSVLLNRKVDLVSRRAIERSGNWIRRESILSTAAPVYVGQQPIHPVDKSLKVR